MIFRFSRKWIIKRKISFHHPKTSIILLHVRNSTPRNKKQSPIERLGKYSRTEPQLNLSFDKDSIIISLGESRRPGR